MKYGAQQSSIQYSSLPYDDRRSVISRGYAESGPVTSWRCLPPVVQASCRNQHWARFLHPQDRVYLGTSAFVKVWKTKVTPSTRIVCMFQC
jgi:hypothetical protein